MSLSSIGALAPSLRTRVEDLIREWRVEVERLRETDSSILAFGHRSGLGVVLKVVKDETDEWLAGQVLRAFQGGSTVQVYEQIDGAMLLEHLHPGHSLAPLARDGQDRRATEILAEVIAGQSPKRPPAHVPAIADWGRAFEWYDARGDDAIPKPLVTDARRLFGELCSSQSHPRLLHGDLHHYNVLHDATRGWIAIDPKGVIGELEYEIGAALRNPTELPRTFADPIVIQTRVSIFEQRLGLDATRILEWGFAQAVLSAIWTVEDRQPPAACRPALAVANTIGSMLG